MVEEDQKSFTESELKKFDGKEGKPAYIAYKGTVYDVSDSRLWRDGKHMRTHNTGIELTDSIVNAPHGEDVFSRYPPVGTFIQDKPDTEDFGHVLRRLIPHPMIIHFPIAYSLIVPILSLLYTLTGITTLEVASYYMLFLGFLTAPICALTGFVSWKTVYLGKRNSAFKSKIRYSIALICVITICTIWRTLNPQILTGETSVRFLYLTILFSLVPIISILGHTGGKIVFS